MRITTKFAPRTRARLRTWLVKNHSKERELWVVYARGKERKPREITYLDIVEECLCFGWIDGILKRHEGKTAQRITPRRPKSNWTELNKHRASVLIKKGLMHPAGRAVIPKRESGVLVIPEPIETALKASPEVWETFQSFPPLYQRIRVSYVAEMLRPVRKEEFHKRLNNLVKKTEEKKMYGNWDDSKLPRTGP